VTTINEHRRSPGQRFIHSMMLQIRGQIGINSEPLHDFEPIIARATAERYPLDELLRISS
jgi:hypothetical protein